MKRTIVTLVSAVTLFGATTPALAFNATRWNQPRVDIRALKEATVTSYLKRWDLSYRRQRYNNLVSQVMRDIPRQLAVTGGGGRTHADFQISYRPTPRGVVDWTLPGHCTSESVRCDN